MRKKKSVVTPVTQVVFALVLCAGLVGTGNSVRAAASKSPDGFVDKCLDWKHKAGFDARRTGARRGCQCIAQHLSTVPQDDNKVARGYLRITLQYPGRTREGLQRYFMERYAQDATLKNVDQAQSTRVFNFLARVMATCKMMVRGETGNN